MDSKTFRHLTGHFATGVAVVTSADPASGAKHGVTVNSFASVSLDPPLVLVCIEHASQSHDFLTSRPTFVINFLARRQVALAERFAGRAPIVSATFDGVAHDELTGGAPRLSGSVAWLECVQVAVYPGGDHSILVGEVRAGDTGDDDDPLIYFGGSYSALAWG
jgi:flavin reductase (DIM6/NTAB) family NADH-FMN oxidoreductase RutF